MPPDPDYSTSTEGSGKPPETASVSPERGSLQSRDRPCDAVPLERGSVQSENTSAAANPHLLRGTAQSISLIETSVLIVPEGPLDAVEPQRDQFLSSGSSRLANCIYQLAKASQIQMEQQKREFQSTKTRPVASPKLAIKLLSQEEFKSTTPSLRRNPNRSGHFIADPPSRHLYVIEVLLKESVAPESNPMRTRTIAHNPQKATVPHNPNQKEIPDRIRLRSTFMLNLLHHITDVKLDHSGGDISVNERTTLLFLYPFKFFMTYLDRIKDETNRLKTKFKKDGQPGQTNPSRVSNDTAIVDSPAQIPGDASTSLETTIEDNYESKKALDHLRLLSRLLLTHLSPIFILRNSYQSGTYDTVSFQDLWLLFEVGGLAFLREPLPGHPPSIVRVTHFNGGRQLLNNGEFRSPEPRQDVNGPNSKGKENRFNIHYYSLNFDGEYYGPVEDGLSIPPWEGTRSVYDLKLFPLVFYNGFVDRKFNSLEELKYRVINRGKAFVRLGAINHKSYNGQGIGTYHEFYNSPVMIDFKLQRQDTESRLGLSGLTECVLKSESGLATGLSIYPGDPREVLEGTPRANNPVECVFPGCDDNDFIHDDILLDNLIAGQKIERYGISSVRFSRSEVRQLSEPDYALFPTFVQGYVLNNRVWAKLDLDLLRDFEGTGGQFNALYIPERHKESLLALVDMGKTRRLALDVVPGKGQGIIILLHGRPGLGKTATAEVMAADMNRPLYPITYADLGDIPSAIETNLKKIFRYCQRWNCIVLLDEADVFLMPRDREDTKRNCIVSIFLRNFEWYPGIIFLTTNRLDQVDEGVLDRIHLKLRYPKLSNDFTKNIFNDHFTRINQSDMPRMEAPTGKHEISRSHYGVTVKEKHMSQIHTWREEQFSKAGKVGWWNGRQIRVAFQLASAFARREMVNAGKDGTASIKLRHFEKVLELYESFTTDLADAQDGKHDE